MTTYLSSRYSCGDWLSVFPRGFGTEAAGAPDTLSRGSWVVVDEVQKLPSLLNEIHAALTDKPKHWKFALTAAELRDSDAVAVDDLVRFGNLPLVRSAKGSADRIDLLEAYVQTYLTQEIRAEALVRSLESFARFLSVAALANAQVTNVASLARDAGVARPTVQGYFEVLSDTLLGSWLPAWRARARVKEVAHPKFYLFDTGVVRALAGRLREPLDGTERGFLLETAIYHELSAHLAYTLCGGDLAYYRTPAGSEVDFIWQRGATRIGIEVKASPRWRPEFGRTLQDLLDERVVSAAYGVYLGDRPLVDKGVRVLPYDHFLRALGAGKILPRAKR